MSVSVLLVLGAVLFAMALAEPLVRRLPLSPSLIYLAVGWAAAGWGGFFTPIDLRDHSALLLPLSEAAVLLSLFAIGLRLGRPAWRGAWRTAVALAGAGLLVTIALVTLAGWWLLALPWAAALLLAAMLSPTDPVLASDVQLRSVEDRDAVRLTLTVEGALNDGTAFPVVMLALAGLGLHALGAWGERWLWMDLLWPVGAGTALGWLCGRAMGAAVRALRRHGHAIDWDELLYLGAITLVYTVASLLHVSTFLAVFACGCALFAPQRGPAASSAQGELRGAAPSADCTDVRGRMMAFGGRIERLVEVSMVLLIGAALARTTPSAAVLGFVAATLLVARPVTVWLVARDPSMTRHQRRLIAWFGIRGVGSIFYLTYALEHGVTGAPAQALIDACLLCIAGSIVLHGMSATPLMEWARRWPMSRR